MGQNIAIEYRWSEGQTEKLPTLVADLVSRKVDVIVTAGAESVNVAKQATATIPIVMTSSQDAVGDGLIASCRRSGSITGGRNSWPRT